MSLSRQWIEIDAFEMVWLHSFDRDARRLGHVEIAHHYIPDDLWSSWEELLTEYQHDLRASRSERAEWERTYITQQGF